MATVQITESGNHWYDADGRPRHAIHRADGKGLRPTTLADARRLALFPSVTTCLSVLARPQLVRWQITQAIHATTEHPYRSPEALEPYTEKIRRLAQREVTRAQDLGTQIHAALETVLHGGTPPPGLQPYIEPALQLLAPLGLRIVATERRLVNHAQGYAGTCDLIALDGHDRPLVVDFKSKRTRPGEKIQSFPDQPMQIAAYARAHFGEKISASGANLYLSTTEPGRAELIHYDPQRIDHEYQAFLHACALWRHLHDYDPRQPLAGALRVAHD